MSLTVLVYTGTQMLFTGRALLTQPGHQRFLSAQDLAQYCCSLCLSLSCQPHIELGCRNTEPLSQGCLWNLTHFQIIMWAHCFSGSSCHDKSSKVNIPAAPRRFMILLPPFSGSHFPCWACFTQLCLVLNIFCTIGNYGIVSIWNYMKLGNHMKLWKLPFQGRPKSQNPQHWRSTMQVTEAWARAQSCTETWATPQNTSWAHCLKSDRNWTVRYYGIQHRKSWCQWHSCTSLLLDKFCQRFCNQPLGAAAGLLISWAANTRGVKAVSSTWENSDLAYLSSCCLEHLWRWAPQRQPSPHLSHSQPQMHHQFLPI